MVWAKAEPAGNECGGTLTVRLRDSKGAWHKRRDLGPSVAMVGGLNGWQPLAVLVTVPEDCAALIVMLGADGQAEGTSALFDDATLYRLPMEGD